MATVVPMLDFNLQAYSERVALVNYLDDYCVNVLLLN